MPRHYSSREVIAALRKAGFSPISQRGSHMKLRDSSGHTVIVKDPAASIPPGTLGSILKQAGMTHAEFEKLV